MPGTPSQTYSSFPPLLGYIPREHIASGGQSSVYRSLNPHTAHLAAIKIVPLAVSPADAAHDAQVQAKAKQLVREMRIHETLKHRNVLQLFGGETRDQCTVVQEYPQGRRNETVWPTGLYMVLDLADGGDLFDKIAPDVGVEEEIAHFYFRQLISGLKYLGKQGICHRDVKPENCLLDGDGNLKISDFGLATVFKYKGQERMLKDRCGSPPYAAPELAHPAPYAAEPVDVWSAGVVLFALLVGNTPWDEPTHNSPEFAAFIDRSLLKMDPWCRIRGGALATLLKLLTLDPAKRPRIKDIELLDWYRQPNPFLNPSTGQCTNGAEISRRLASALHAHQYMGQPTSVWEEVMAASQTAASLPQGPSQGLHATQMALSQRGLDPNASFRGSMQLYSRLSMAPTQRTNPNLTRFFTTTPLATLLSTLDTILSSLAIPHEVLTLSPSSSDPPRVATLGELLARVRAKTTDRRRERLVFAIHVSRSVLPSEEEAASSQRMDTDSDDGEDDSPLPVAGGGGEDEKAGGVEGFDVVCMKREADPLELKRVWKSVLERLPEGVVVAT
ncbi:hypothetical protein JCM1841_003539 [Sporobolomyces salmonicolor]